MLFVMVFALFGAITFSAAALGADSTGVVLPGGTAIPWLEIGGIIAAIYELLVRTIKTKVKFWSIIEIVYRVIQFLIPNRTTDSVSKGEKHLFNFLRRKS